MKPPKQDKSQPMNPRSSMHKDSPDGGERSAGSLNSEIQIKIGQKLRAMYDDVVREGVPDRFVDLLRKLEKPPGEGQSE